MANIRDILPLLNAVAPFEMAEEWDNVGLLAGNPDAEVKRILCALDLNLDVIARAKEISAQLIVTHHPILFRGRKNLREDDPEGKLLCALIRSGVGLIAMHTNFDAAHPGVNDALAQALSLQNVCGLPCGLCAGDLEKTETLHSFEKCVETALGDAVRVYGSEDKRIRRVAVMGGSGGDYVKYALEMGADAFVTGEIGYHKALDAAALGLCIFEAGHGATEKPAISLLCSALQKQINAVQYEICVDSI